MKQKERWAKEETIKFLQENKKRNPFSPELWLAGFEFAKKAIGDKYDTDWYGDAGSSRAIDDIGEEEVDSIDQV